MHHYCENLIQQIPLYYSITGDGPMKSMKSLYVSLVACEQASECTNLAMPPQCHLVLYKYILGAKSEL